ncbi:multicopper oxidase domain-containing protein [Methylocaldum sp. 14B]|uniref:multicopper oxidase domain-containing protein n=1 Tax=Methylocaldum sp. 14B TaxID=1912213 RepID=UPI00143C3BD3|nr:multicopper oxidase domain-containing protein [Methylocaldum sp. 14B]
MNPKISTFLKRLAVALSGVLLIGVAEAAEYTLTAEEIDWEPRPGLKLKGWAYNGQIPGPEIRVKEGELVTIHFTNNLPVPTGIHWHGVEVPADMDGVPGVSQEAVPPGGKFVYKFIAKPAGTRFYHTHGSGGPIPDEAMQMQMGLYGAFIVEGKNERRADREYTVILSDRNEKLDPMMTDTNPDSV